MDQERNRPSDLIKLAEQIRVWGEALGFQQVGISGINLPEAETRLLDWLEKDRHGAMEYMAQHGTKRTRPGDLLPGTIRVISARMDYLPNGAADSHDVMNDKSLGMISRYALGRDYHKIMRKRLQKLANRIEQQAGPHGYRVFSDSAPVMEKALAEKSGLGWIGKHTNLIAKETGSWFFLGEIYTDLPLPTDSPAANHCGTCNACIDVCPTQAIVAPYELDARRCISYLTIELKDSIPVELRPLVGNRIYGCDDCQLVCPWNRFAQQSKEMDFRPRHGLDRPDLIELFGWTGEQFLQKTEGSALRRIGYEQWLRNVAVALGNSNPDPRVIAALRSRQQHESALVREHVAWALSRLTETHST